MKGSLRKEELEKSGWKFLTNYDTDDDLGCGDCCGGPSKGVDFYETSPNHYVSDHATTRRGEPLKGYVAIYVKTED